MFRNDEYDEDATLNEGDEAVDFLDDDEKNDKAESFEELDFENVDLASKNMEDFQEMVEGVDEESDPLA